MRMAISAGKHAPCLPTHPKEPTTNRHHMPRLPHPYGRGSVKQCILSGMHGMDLAP